MAHPRREMKKTGSAISKSGGEGLREQRNREGMGKKKQKQPSKTLNLRTLRLQAPSRVRQLTVYQV